MCNRDNGNRHPSARRDPLLVSLELDAEPVVEDPQISVLITHNRLWHDHLHFLRHHPDIGAIAAVITETIVADAVGEMAKQNDVVLERDIGSPSAATTTASAATTTTETTTATRSHPAGAGAASPATHACAAARGLPIGYPAGPDIPKGVAAAPSPRRPLPCAWPST